MRLRAAIAALLRGLRGGKPAAEAFGGPSGSRRSFLKSVGLGATGAIAPPAPPAPVVIEGTKVAPVVVLPESRVSGTRYRLDTEGFAALRKGMRLAFRREPQNHHDKRAVLIEVSEEGHPTLPLGYVSRHENRTVCDLLDAGHDVAGELLAPRTFRIRRRLEPGEELPANQRLIEVVKRYPEGARIVDVEHFEVAFRAWIATGQVAAARPPDAGDVPGEPAWTVIVPEYQARELAYETYFVKPVAWRAGMELAIRPAGGTYPLSHLSLVMPTGQVVGPVDAAHQGTVRQAMREGRALRAVVVGIGEQKWSGAPPSPSPILEIRASKVPLPPAPENPFARKPEPADPETPVSKEPHSPDARTPLPTPPVLRVFGLAEGRATESVPEAADFGADLRKLVLDSLPTLLDIRPVVRDWPALPDSDATLGSDAGGRASLVILRRPGAGGQVADFCAHLRWLAQDGRNSRNPWIAAADWSRGRLIVVDVAFSEADIATARNSRIPLDLVRVCRIGADWLVLETIGCGLALSS